MGRPFDFTRATLKAVRFRQRNLCAHCGTDLADEWDHGHHVVPNQCGNPAAPAHQWLRSAINCVLICDRCHDRVHNEDTRGGAVAPPRYFPHSHELPQDHRLWAAQLEKAADEIWEYVKSRQSSR